MPFLKTIFHQKILGIDIGVAAIKVVEISQWGGSHRLENYAEMQLDLLPKELLPQEKTNLPPRNFVASALKAMIREAKIKSREAVFALPDFSTFCANFELPPMPEKEIPGAIELNAAKYLASPVTDVMLDWVMVPGAKNAPIKVFLVAIPNQLIDDYRFIARQAGLDLRALESEAFGVLRAINGKPQKTICLVDIGSQSVTFSIAEQGLLRRSFSLNFNGEALAKSFSKPLAPIVNQAVTNPAIKNEVGGTDNTIDTLVSEITNMVADFSRTEQSSVQAVYVTGGMAVLPGLKEYLSQKLRMPVSIPNSFSSMHYPAALSQTLEGMSPRFAASVGVAMGVLQR